VQRIILCPKCHVQVKKDNLGELLCPNCNVRLCPEAHIFNGKICPRCGWEDPNYQLWQTAQKTRPQSPASQKSDESSQIKPQYTCPNCGASVDIAHKDCPSCGFLGAKYRATRAAPISAASTTVRSPSPVRPFLDKIPSAPPKKGSIGPTRSPLLKEIAKAERREWKFPPLGRFVRPVLASLLACAVVSGLVLGGIYITRFVSQSTGPGTQPSPPPLTPSKTYTLSTNVVPETGGEIRIVSPSSSSGTFEPNSQITLMAIPDDCYTLNYWEGDASGSSENVTIIMDSDKTVAAHFSPKDTTPPAISNVEVPKCTDMSATITWETDEPATSHVEYGKTKDYGLSAKSNGEPTTSHKIQLTGLEPSTTYYFMVKSADKCGNVNPQPTSTKTFKTLSDIPVGYEVGKRAPGFELAYWEDPNPLDPRTPNKGGKATLTAFREKIVLLNFWSTRCGACLKEFPLFWEIYYRDNRCKENTGELAIITIGLDGRTDRIKLVEDEYHSEYCPFTFPILLEKEEEPIRPKYRIWRIPTTFLIDKDGIIRGIRVGRFENMDDINKFISDSSK